MKRALDLLTIFMTLFVAVSCSTDEPADSFAYTDIATIKTMSATSGTTFTFYRHGSATPVNVATRYLFDSNIVKEGDRVLLNYTSTSVDPLSSPQSMILRTYRRVPVIVAGDPAAMASDAQSPDIMAAWLTGEWLNVRMTIPYDPAHVTLGATSSISNDATHLTIYIDRTDDTPTFMRETYMCINIASLPMENIVVATPKSDFITLQPQKR